MTLAKYTLSNKKQNVINHKNVRHVVIGRDDIFLNLIAGIKLTSGSGHTNRVGIFPRFIKRLNRDQLAF